MKKIILFVNICILSVISTAGSSDSAFADDKNLIVGRWIGTVSNPWTTPYNVGFVFYKDGTYASQAMGPTCMGTTNAQVIGTPRCSLVTMPALYWGSDGSEKKKTFGLASDDENNLKGYITIYFPALGTSAKGVDNSTTVEVPFESIQILTKDAGNGTKETLMNFSIFRKDIKTIGPVKYSLKKIPEMGRGEDKSSEEVPDYKLN